MGILLFEAGSPAVNKTNRTLQSQSNRLFKSFKFLGKGEATTGRMAMARHFDARYFFYYIIVTAIMKDGQMLVDAEPD